MITLEQIKNTINKRKSISLKKNKLNINFLYFNIYLPKSVDFGNLLYVKPHNTDKLLVCLQYVEDSLFIYSHTANILNNIDSDSIENQIINYNDIIKIYDFYHKTNLNDNNIIAPIIIFDNICIIGVFNIIISNRKSEYKTLIDKTTDCNKTLYNGNNSILKSNKRNIIYPLISLLSKISKKTKKTNFFTHINKNINLYNNTDIKSKLLKIPIILILNSLTSYMPYFIIEK